MARQWFTRIVLVCGLVLAPVCPRVSAAPNLADANGDQAVDVLDLQQAVAALLSPDSTSQLADVNNDGAVDILDVQRILNAATQTAPEQPADEIPPAPATTPAPAATVLAMADILQLRLALLPIAAPSTPLPAATPAVPPHTQFRLRCITAPHAPPGALTDPYHG